MAWCVASVEGKPVNFDNMTPHDAARERERTMLSDEKIREILAIEERATPKPWFEQYEYDGGRTVCQMRSTDTTFCVNRAAHVEGNPYEKTKENGSLIATARNHIRGLGEEVLRLRAEVASLKQALECKKGGDPAEWPKDLQVQEVPNR